MGATHQNVMVYRQCVSVGKINVNDLVEEMASKFIRQLGIFLKLFLVVGIKSV